MNVLLPNKHTFRDALILPFFSLNDRLFLARLPDRDSMLVALVKFASAVVINSAIGLGQYKSCARLGVVSRAVSGACLSAGLTQGSRSVPYFQAQHHCIFDGRTKAVVPVNGTKENIKDCFKEAFGRRLIELLFQLGDVCHSATSCLWDPSLNNFLLE